jgi:CheY-like chemotaxis protein/anti-sigma regulatory factor (Ser/Thr protein kinase)
MATVLVVDDSAGDRRLVGELLGAHGDLSVAFAVDGAEALAKIERQLPDLVVTDLVMPQMDGLELVSALRSRYPLVPAILITSRGSEEIAVRALRQGAASYVPKRLLAGELLATVHGVLAVSSRERSQARLMRCLTKSHCTFTLENDCSLFGPLVAYLQDAVAYMGVCDQADRTRIGVALEEALANALYHGNLRLGSELREEDSRAYYALAEQHRRQEPYQYRHIHVTARLTRRQATIVVRDEGAGFDPATLPDPSQPANLEKVSGRGVLLMRTFMDEVVYNELGNAVTLIKRSDRQRRPE